MNILVTGGFGFIGCHVVHELEKQGHDVTVTDTETTYGVMTHTYLAKLMVERKKKIKTTKLYDIDITDMYMMNWLCKNGNFDAVIHLASYPRQKVVQHNPMQANKTMVQGTLNSLQAYAYGKIKRVVFISSSMVYGNFSSGVKEDAKCDPKGLYGIFKLTGEYIVKEMQDKFDYIIIRPSAVYGALDVEDRVVGKFFADAMNDRPLIVRGISEMLDFTYVEDLANGIVAATTNIDLINKTYNLTRGRAHSLLDAAHTVVDIVGKGKIEVIAKDDTFPSRGALDITAAQKDFGYNPKVDIEEGFKLYHEWLQI